MREPRSINSVKIWFKSTNGRLVNLGGPVGTRVFWLSAPAVFVSGQWLTWSEAIWQLRFVS